jgi:hypothetical protein
LGIHSFYNDQNWIWFKEHWRIIEHVFIVKGETFDLIIIISKIRFLLLSETSSSSQFEIRITFIQICVSQLKWDGPRHYTIAAYDLSHSVEHYLNISSNGKLSEVLRLQKRVSLYV